MALNEYGALKRVALRHPRVAFADQARIDSQWRGHGYHAAPELEAALVEYERFSEALAGAGAELVELPDGADLTIDGIYVLPPL